MKDVSITEETITFQELKSLKYDNLYLLSSDYHIGTHKRVNSYNSELSNVLEKAREICASEIFFGDFFDKPNPSTLDILAGIDILKKMEDRPSNMIAGNHVKSSYTTDDIVDVLLHAIGSVNIKRYSTPTTVDIGNNVTLTHIPYSPIYISRPETLSALLKDYDVSDDKVNICGLHLPIMNAVFDNGILSESGCNLPPDAFDKFDLVCGGDFHTPQWVEYFNTPMMYVGAPMQFSFAHKFNPIVRYMRVKDSEVYIYNVDVNTIDTTTRFTFWDIDDQKIYKRSAEKEILRIRGTHSSITDRRLNHFMNSDKYDNIIFVDDRKHESIKLLEHGEDEHMTDLTYWIEEQRQVRGPALVSKIVEAVTESTEELCISNAAPIIDFYFGDKF